MCELIFGDNQFFGINHMSETKARQQQIRFSSTEKILDLLDQVWELGFRSFMFSTHGELAGILAAALERRMPFAREGRFYPVIPYAHKYADVVTEKGILKGVLDLVEGGALRKLGLLARGLVRKDVSDLMKPLVDAEMALFDGVSVRCVLLQNIVTDLVLGLRRGDLLAEFVRYVRDRYGCEAGIITMNPALAREVLEAHGVGDAAFCFSLNSAGFLMNPSRESAEEVATRHEGRLIAMNVLAGGAVGPRGAAKYLAGLRERGSRMDAVVYGASTARHAEEMVAELRAAGLC